MIFEMETEEMEASRLLRQDDLLGLIDRGRLCWRSDVLLVGEVDEDAGDWREGQAVSKAA